MAAHFDYLIAGLGNPGSKYSETRHNIGWMVAIEYARRHKAEIKTGDILYYESKVRYEGKKALVIIPVTYMNNSGEAVAKAMNKHDIVPGQLVVIADEYNFPVGRVHLKKGGSDGGHNGVYSIIEEINSAEFWRLRCGIGRDFGPGGLVDWVLSVFKPEEDDAKEEMIKKAVSAIDIFISTPPGKAMSLINQTEPD